MTLIKSAPANRSGRGTLLAAAMVLFSSRLLLAADEPIATSVHQLLAAPANFNGKRIAVTGHYMTFVEDSALYSDAKAAETMGSDNSIWLDLTTLKTGPSSRQPVRHGLVRVVGTFQHTPERMIVERNGNRQTTTIIPGSGHNNMWSSQITAITEFRNESKKDKK